MKLYRGDYYYLACQLQQTVVVGKVREYNYILYILILWLPISDGGQGGSWVCIWPRTEVRFFDARPSFQVN